MHLTVLVLHELIRHELAPALKIIWGKSLSSGAPSECDWKTGVMCSAIHTRTLNWLETINAVHIVTWIFCWVGDVKRPRGQASRILWLEPRLSLAGTSARLSCLRKYCLGSNGVNMFHQVQVTGHMDLEVWILELDSLLFRTARWVEVDLSQSDPSASLLFYGHWLMYCNVCIIMCRIQKILKFWHLQSQVLSVPLQQVRCLTLMIWRKGWH